MSIIAHKQTYLFVRRSRERNREHAKRSRVRKKFLLDSLQRSVDALQVWYIIDYGGGCCCCNCKGGGGWCLVSPRIYYSCPLFARSWTFLASNGHFWNLKKTHNFLDFLLYNDRIPKFFVGFPFFLLPFASCATYLLFWNGAKCHFFVSVELQIVHVSDRIS